MKPSHSKPEGLLIRGGRIIDPSQGIDSVGDLFVAGGKIAWIGARQPCAPETEVLDAARMIVCPGFIDLHCHLRQPGYEEKETIATGARAAARGGFTTVCCMPNTKPAIDTPATVKYIRDTAAREAVINVLPIGCITRERKGTELSDMTMLATTGVVGFSDDGSTVARVEVMRHALEQAKRLNLPIMDHCQDASLAPDGVTNDRPLARKLGLKGIPNAAEENIVARDIALARSTGGRVHICHVSTAGSVDLIREARKEGVRLTAEVTPHHLTLTEEMVAGNNTNAKVNPPLRTKKDVEALAAALKDGTIDAIATDHAPHTLKDKQCDFPSAAFGISGLETALGSLMGLVHSGKLDLVTMISKLTVEPARIINRTAGTLKPGASADITIFDPDSEWVVDPAKFASKGRNTPLAGQTLKGKVMATLVSGKIIYVDQSMKRETSLSKTGASIG